MFSATDYHTHKQCQCTIEKVILRIEAIMRYNVAKSFIDQIDSCNIVLHLTIKWYPKMSIELV